MRSIRNNGAAAAVDGEYLSVAGNGSGGSVDTSNDGEHIAVATGAAVRGGAGADSVSQNKHNATNDGTAAAADPTYATYISSTPASDATYYDADPQDNDATYSGYAQPNSDA
jgi:hypothetical protein